MAKTAKKSSGGKSLTKTEIYKDISEKVGLSKKQVESVFDHLTDMIKKELTKGPKIFTVPGLMKIQVRTKPATKEREGVNPKTLEKIIIKAKPASKVVKVRPLKALKEMVLKG
jgi:nucleoid DNA-binding protein